MAATRGMRALLLGLVVLGAACGGGDGGGASTTTTTAPTTTRASLPPSAGRPGEVNAKEAPAELQAVLAVPVDAVRDDQADRYWEVLSGPCREYHRSVEQWRGYFARKRAGLLAVLGILENKQVTLDSVALDPAGTWVQLQGDRAQVRMRVAAADGQIIVDPDTTSPVLWRLEGGQWRTTDCLFESERAFDEDGELRPVGRATSTTTP